MALVISMVVFVAVCSAIALFGYHRYVLPGRLYQSLDHVSDDAESLPHAANPNFFTVSRAAEMVARKLPPSTGVASALQLKLLSGGYREQNAATVFFGLKVIVTAGATTLAMLFFAFNSSTGFPLKIAGLAVAVLAGFRLPDYFLARRIKRRQKLLRKGLPDALDLIVVCAEAGLTIDRSFSNVSQQLALMHPALCEEFSLFTAEISAGPAPQRSTGKSRQPHPGNGDPQVRRGPHPGGPLRYQHGRCAAHARRLSAHAPPPGSGRKSLQSRA